MQKYRVLYNPLAGGGKGRETAAKVEMKIDDGVFSYADIRRIEDVYSYILALPDDERVIIAGGDGTLNHFVNAVGGRGLARDIYYFPSGSGNDFAADVDERHEKTLILLNDYIKDLPTVTVNGETRYFINGIGYGIDGYCCEEGDKRRESSAKPVNYTAIAIKGLLFYFHPVQATVTVDGVTHRYKKVWLAPTMNGRYYGGGMDVAPAQNRLSPGHELSVVVMHGSGKLKTLAVFPGIFKGEHVKHTEMVEVLTGHDISVEFDRPTALQIDGETVSGVRAYRSETCAARSAPNYAVLS